MPNYDDDIKQFHNFSLTYTQRLMVLIKLAETAKEYLNSPIVKKTIAPERVALGLAIHKIETMQNTIQEALYKNPNLLRRDPNGAEERTKFIQGSYTTQSFKNLKEDIDNSLQSLREVIAENAKDAQIAKIHGQLSRGQRTEAKPLPAKPVNPKKPLPAKPVSPNTVKPLPVPPTKPKSTRTTVTEKSPLPPIPRKLTATPATPDAPAESQVPTAPPFVAAASAEPMAPESNVESSKNDLLAQIAKGKALNKANTEKRAATPPPANDLFSLLKNQMDTRRQGIATSKTTSTTVAAPSTPTVKKTLPRAAGSMKTTPPISAPSTPSNVSKPVSVAKQSQSAPSTPTQDTPQHKKTLSGGASMTPKQTTSSIPAKKSTTSRNPEKPIATAGAISKAPTRTSTSAAPVAPTAPTEFPTSTLEGPAPTKIAFKRPPPINTEAPDRGGLLAAIREGKALKKVEPPVATKDNSTPVSPASSDSESPSSPPLSFLFRMKEKTAALAEQKAKANNSGNDESWDDEPSPSPKNR